MKNLILCLMLVLIVSCNSLDKKKEKYLELSKVELPGSITFSNPFDGAVFPPEFPSPTIMWDDDKSINTHWFVSIKTSQSEGEYCSFVDKREWKPDVLTWDKIKQESKENPATITVIGFDEKNKNTINSGAKIQISVSADSVGAPVFYRAVPLPFSFATSHLDSIKYMLGDISSEEQPKILLENLPVCGNCHSFSPDGKRFAMDVDAFGDKGSYLVSEVEKEVTMSPESFITWSDFQEKSTMALLSQISPNGKYVVSTLDDNEIFESRDELEYSQLFFPIKGILTVYDVDKKTYSSLPGASDTMYVQSNPNWSPDNKSIYFAKGRAVQRKQSGMTYGTGVYDINKFQAMRDSFLTAKKKFKFDVMKILFNEGKGGKAIPVKGASENNKSNYFSKISPDGKWMVFCQAENYMLLQPDSKLYIMPTDGSEEPRLMNCNTSNMNSWHSWSPNGRWLVFSSKIKGAYTQLMLAHVDENGIGSPPVWLENLRVDNRAANIPEFVNVDFNDFNKIIDDFSDVADYNVRGTSKAQFGDFKNAIIDFNKALQINKNDHQAYANRGKAKDELGDLTGALEDLSKAIELNPEESGYYIHRSNTKVKMRNLQGAIDDCSKAIKIKPKDATLYAHRAGIYKMDSKFDKSIEDFSMAIKLDPDYSLYYLHRAQLFNDQKKTDSANKDINKAISLEPKNVKYITLKGIIAKNRGDNKEAIECFKKAIKVNATYYEPYSELAIINEEMGELEESISNFEKAIEHYDKESKKDLALIYNNKGTVYGKLKDYGNAINNFNQALNYWPNSVDAYSNRAFANLNLGRYQDAELDCNTALQIEPGMKKAKIIKEMIRKEQK